MTNNTHETIERQRADIDHGRGDAVPAADPASAPLGTDDEAAGFPLGGERIATTWLLEQSGPRSPPEPDNGLGHAWIIVGVVLLMAAIFAVAGLSLR